MTFEDREAHRLASCYGKRAYKEKAAKNAAKLSKGSAYRCEYCHAWHIGGGLFPTRKNKRRRRRR